MSSPAETIGINVCITQQTEITDYIEHDHALEEPPVLKQTLHIAISCY